jgi:LuxR family maltose regulon positive regulatory protein
LSLLRAPAGFGKTTLMLEWWRCLEQRGARCAWLTLDAADDDIEQLTRHLQAAFSRVPAFAGLGEPDSSLQPDRRALAARLAQLSRRHASRTALFIDELDTLRTPQARELLRSMLHDAQLNVAFIVAARETPELGQMKLRLQDDFLELTTDDLRFRKDEAQSFITGWLGALLTDAETADLFARTDGWITALQLACHAIASNKQRASVVKQLADFQDDLGDYLAREVLATQSPAVRQFLLDTSPLQIVTAALCDAVLGRSDSESILAELEGRGLFLKRIDDDNGVNWYRYHDLFAQFLQRTQRSQSPERVAAVYRSSARWFAASGMLIEAAEHARLGGDLELGNRLFDSAAMSFIHIGQFNAVISWAERLPRDALTELPNLHLAYLWALAFSDRPRAARRVIEQLRRIDSELKQFAAPIRNSLLCLELIVAGRTDDLEMVCRQGPATLAQVSKSDVFHYGALSMVLAHGNLAAGKFCEARETLAQAKSSMVQEGRTFGVVFLHSMEGMAHLSELRLQEALAHLQAGFTLARSRCAGVSHTSALVAGFLADALYEANELERARALLEEHLPLIVESGLPDTILLAYVTMARVAFRHGDDAGGLGFLLAAELIGLQRDLPRFVTTARYEMAQHAYMRGDWVEALRQAASCEGLVSQSHSGELLTPLDAVVRDIAPARMQVWQKDTRNLGARLDALSADAERRGFKRRLLKLRILNAQRLSLEGNRSGAITHMTEALLAGLSGGFFRTFLDEGPLAMDLVRAARRALLERLPPEQAALIAQRYESLLAAPPTHSSTLNRVAFGKQWDHSGGKSPDAARVPVFEHLTRRELDILRCLERGLTNGKIAVSLRISATTTKWHLRNIFGKLGVVNRTEAVFSARQLDLI